MMKEIDNMKEQTEKVTREMRTLESKGNVFFFKN
jgi:hypothetical protein